MKNVIRFIAVLTFAAMLLPNLSLAQAILRGRFMMVQCGTSPSLRPSLASA